MSNQDSGKPGARSRWSATAPGYAPPGGAAADPARERLMRLAREAGGHLDRARADLASEPVAELLRALPQDPLVQHLVRQREVVAFEWPLPRSAFAIAPRIAPPPEAIDLVAFHVDMPSAPSGIHGAIDYTAVLALSFESARLRAPRARRILLTDEATRVPESMAVDRVLRFPIDPARLMYERMRVQSRYLEAREGGRASVLMDSDVVVNRDPAPIFAEAFDVGLTWRPGFADAPFNGGMIFVSEGTQGCAFFRAALACYDALAAHAPLQSAFPRDLRAWWGDQFALAATVGLRAYREHSGEGLRVDGTAVRFFPCETHNFTLEPARRHSAAELRSKHFVHFKGNRKALQAQYLDAMRKGGL